MGKLVILRHVGNGRNQTPELILAKMDQNGPFLAIFWLGCPIWAATMLYDNSIPFRWSRHPTCLFVGSFWPILAYFLAPQPMLSYIILLWSVLGPFELIQDWPWLEVKSLPKKSILLWWNFFLMGTRAQFIIKVQIGPEHVFWTMLGQIGGYVFFFRKWPYVKLQDQWNGPYFFS